MRGAASMRFPGGTLTPDIGSRSVTPSSSNVSKQPESIARMRETVESDSPAPPDLLGRMRCRNIFEKSAAHALPKGIEPTAGAMWHRRYERYDESVVGDMPASSRPSR